MGLSIRETLHRTYTDCWLARHGKVEGRKLSMLMPRCAVLRDEETLVQPTKLQNPGAGVKIKQKTPSKLNKLLKKGTTGSKQLTIHRETNLSPQGSTR